eukprot:NODE_2240_length_597_cov_265.235401_g1771_i0.p5 GENE.NODE_2240_length_597_cov_265.235401_g1771_i0~~NODE_2240_length_597_cov_265.235401_g1771_i0.p5  ORF type:complete len:63 (+),score=10.77 NODE_2240_length_597_cov_265.235401_g1771_i0:169-357(+)
MYTTPTSTNSQPTQSDFVPPVSPITPSALTPANCPTVSNGQAYVAVNMPSSPSQYRASFAIV